MSMFLTIMLVICSLGLIFSVLMQSGKSAGMSGAISGGADQVFGKKKGLDDLFSKISTCFAAGFIVFAMILSIVQ